MAFSQVIKGTLDLGGAKLVWGTFNAASVTTGTIDFRGTLGGTAVKVPFEVIGGAVCDHTTAADVNPLWSSNGTCAIEVTSSDTGTWFFLIK